MHGEVTAKEARRVTQSLSKAYYQLEATVSHAETTSGVLNEDGASIQVPHLLFEVIFAVMRCARLLCMSTHMSSKQVYSKPIRNCRS